MSNNSPKMEHHSIGTEKAVLYLIPTPLGEVEPMLTLPFQVKKIIEKLTYFIVENEKQARRFIKQICLDKKQSELILYPLNKFTDPKEVIAYLNPIQKGHSIGLLSDAGCPGIADPGANIVNLAHRNKLTIKPLVGPSSILLAMMSSGFNGQNFAFNGYLPIDKKQRQKEIKTLEKKVFNLGQSQIFIETPYRNNKMIDDLISTLDRNTSLCIAANISLPSEFILTLTIKEWKKEKIELNKQPAIFIIGN